MVSKTNGWLKPKPDERPLKSGLFQIIWGVYFGVLAWFLMSAADARAGGVGGVSLLLVGIIFVFGFTLAYLSSLHNSLYWIFLEAILIGIIFTLLIGLGIKSTLAFGFQQPGPERPIIRGTLIYAGAASVVFSRLQRPFTPSTKKADTELAQVYFDNNWRLFQIIVSLTGITVVGVIFPAGTVIIQQQDVVLKPLALYSGGIILGLFPLVAQLLFEMHYLEVHYDK